MTDHEAQSLRARCIEWALTRGLDEHGTVKAAKVFEAYIRGDLTEAEQRADMEAEASRMQPDVLDPPANETEDEAFETRLCDVWLQVGSHWPHGAGRPLTNSDTSIHTSPNGQEPNSTDNDAAVSDPFGYPQGFVIFDEATSIDPEMFGRPVAKPSGWVDTTADTTDEIQEPGDA